MTSQEHMMESQDYDWEPPSGAQMKLIQARRERSDRIAKLMGDYLLKGYKMLGITCSRCDTILLQDRQDVKYCVACSELDSDADKDDPATNEAAALAQARELQLLNSPRDTVVTADSSTAHTLPALSSAAPATQQGLASSRMEITTSSLSGGGDFQPAGRLNNSDALYQSPGAARGQLNISCQPVGIAPHADAGLASVDGQRYVGELVGKLEWAVEELKRTPSVEYSIQLCQLIKGCADAISSVRSAFTKQ